MVKVQQYTITPEHRKDRNGHKTFVIWLTGLSGAGKSTLADRLEQYLFEEGKQVFVLDGDNVRNGINKGLGFSKEDRKENIRRVAEIARLFCDAGMIIITAFISPYISDREMAKQIIGEENFVEVFLDADIRVCEERDVKGLYAKARTGHIKEFTGVSDVYEVPVRPSLTINTGNEPIDTSFDILVSWLKENCFLP